MPKGKLIIVIGPSGVGKKTLNEYLLTIFPQCELSVSATTRKPRPNEVEGVDYHFLTVEAFQKKIAENAFAEYAPYADNYYGTLKSEIDPRIESWKSVLIEIEVQGAFQLMARYPDAVSIFILPPEPMISTLRARLIARAEQT